MKTLTGKEKSVAQSNSPIHRKFHFLFIVRNRGMDLLELHPQLGINVPPQRRTDDPGAKVVASVFRVANHHRKILRDVFQQNMERMHGTNHRFALQDSVVKHVAFRGRVGESKITGISCAVELKRILHNLLAAKFAAGEVVEHQLPIFSKKTFAVHNPRRIALLQFQPPIGFHFGKR